MTEQQQHLLAYVQDGSAETSNTGNSIDATSSSKRQLKPKKGLKKSNTVEQTISSGKNRLKTGLSLESKTWKLNYQDFLPTPLQSSVKTSTDGYWEKSEIFQKLVDRANNWLKKNVGVQLKSCETITCSSRDKDKMASWSGNDATSNRSLAEGKNTYFARGLRLWFGPSSYDYDREHQISFFDIVPEVESRISDLVVMVNKKMDEKQLRGRIVSLDTIACPLYKNSVHSTATRWLENVDQDWPNAYVLRIFYLKSHLRKHLKALDPIEGALGIKDFQPKKTSTGYEGFELLVEKANNFIQQQVNNNISVCLSNLQSVLIYKNQDPSHERGPYSYFTTPGLNTVKPIEIFRVLRLYYFVTPSISGQQMTSHPSAMFYSSKLPPSCKYSTFTYETFVPEFSSIQTGDDGDGDGDDDGAAKNRLELMDEVFYHVTQFLQTYDTEVFCAETVMNPIQMYFRHQLMKDLIHKIRKKRHGDDNDDDKEGGDDDDSMYFIFTFRLFLTCSENSSKAILPSYHLPPIGGAQEATVVQAVQQQHTHQQQQQQQAPEKDVPPAHSPLFLRNVVGRQFKYRWLALAISAFTCMAIIVAVSVIYSNK